MKTTVYNSLVRPQAAAVWDPYTGENILLDKLEMAQRRAARYVCNNHIQIASVTGMLQKLGWRSLEQRRADIRLLFLFKSINGLPTNLRFPVDRTPELHFENTHHHPNYNEIIAELVHGN